MQHAVVTFDMEKEQDYATAHKLLAGLHLVSEVGGSKLPNTTAIGRIGSTGDQLARTIRDRFAVKSLSLSRLLVMVGGEEPVVWDADFEQKIRDYVMSKGNGSKNK
jgi:hypothetical protein